MVRVIIGMSGSGKTYLLKEELVHKYIGGVTQKDIFVIERKEYEEYSHIFHPDYITVIKSDSDLVEYLLYMKNKDIIIDCEDYSEEFMKTVSVIVKCAEKNNNNVTITFLGIYDDIYLERAILMNANKLLIGKCDMMSEIEIEKLFGRKLEAIREKYDFREF